jgi:hypothetical protein
MNSSAKPNIFITGGTGYIAGSLLHLMMLRNYPREFRISALVRRSRNLLISPYKSFQIRKSFWVLALATRRRRNSVLTGS